MADRDPRSLRASDGGRVDDVLEVAYDHPKFRPARVRDAGLVPYSEWSISMSYREIGRVVSSFLGRLNGTSMSRHIHCLVPMQEGEYRAYREWKDSQVKSGEQPK